MTPDEWLADFEAKAAELLRHAVAFRRNLEEAGQLDIDVSVPAFRAPEPRKPMPRPAPRPPRTARGSLRSREAGGSGLSAPKRVAGVVGLVVLLVGLLSGCNLFVQYYEDVDELCKKIVADWKAQAEVVDASYVYVHGIDSGQQIDFDVIVRAESDTAEVLERLEDIANRDYWLSTAYDREDRKSFQYVVYSSDNPPVKGEVAVSKSIGQGDIGVSPKVGLEKYGPRPTTK